MNVEPLILDGTLPLDFDTIRRIGTRVTAFLATEFPNANVNEIVGGLVGATFAEVAFSCETEAEIAERTARLVAILRTNEEALAEAGVMMWATLSPDRQDFDS